MAMTRSAPGAPPSGMVWDASVGGWVNKEQAGKVDFPNEQPYVEGAPSSQVAGAANAAAASNSAGSGAGYAVDPYGYTSYNNSDQQGRVTDQFHAKLQADAETRRLAAISSLRTTGASAAPVAHDAVVGNEQAARAAAFARAKDQSGQIARSSLTALSNLMAARGTSGSGIEDLRSAGVLQGAAAPLQDLTREQYIEDLNRSADISDESYRGNIQQRGQDLSAQQAQQQSLLGLIQAAYSGRAY